jgi:hypothetical protein
MWDLQTIIRMNNEAFALKKKNSTPKGQQEKAKGDEGVRDSEKRVFGKVTYLRSVYEGEVDRHSPQSWSGETLP